MQAKKSFSLGKLFRKLTGQKDKPTKVYGFCREEEDGLFKAIAIDEQGQILVKDSFPNVDEADCDRNAAKHLGMSEGSKRKHYTYNAYHEKGWRCEYVVNKKVETHKGLNRALDKLRTPTPNMDKVDITLDL